MWLSTETMDGFFEHDDEISGVIKYRRCIGWLNNCWILRMDSASRSYLIDRQ